MLEPPVTPIRKANDGLELPATGFGTYKVNGLAGVDAIKFAIHQGYRLIDSAFNYENEGVVGRAIRESGVPREDIIVTSKLPGRHHAHDEALLTIEESVCRMGLDYIDLYLIHWPNPSQGQFVEAWEALVEARERRTLRYRRIEVNYEDRRFRARHATFAGWTAQIIQHEVDHCNGIII